AAVERQHDPTIKALHFLYRSQALGHVQVDRFLAQHRFALANGTQNQADVGVGRGADNDGLDVVAIDGRLAVKHGFGAEGIGQALSGIGERICHDYQLGKLACSDVGCVNLADTTGAENCDTYHFLSPGNSIVRCCRRAKLQWASTHQFGNLIPSNCAMVVSKAFFAATSSGSLRSSAEISSTPQGPL